MSDQPAEQRVPDAAEHATTDAADPGEGQGLADPAAHRGGVTGGEAAAVPPRKDRQSPASEDSAPHTEGTRYVADEMDLQADR